MKALHEIDSARAAVLFGLFVGLGIAVHAAFFLLAAIPIAVKVMHAIHEHHEQTRLAYRAR
jgi:hypothetical protein